MMYELFYGLLTTGGTFMAVMVFAFYVDRRMAVAQERRKSVVSQFENPKNEIA